MQVNEQSELRQHSAQCIKKITNSWQSMACMEYWGRY